MAEDKPYAPVVAALLKQTRAINQLARELKEEFSQYQSAIQSRDTKRANAIADAINQRTARLVAATEKLDASVPDAAPGGGPADPSGRPDQGLPGVDRPTDPGFDRPTDPTRPDQGLPGRDRPTDPGFGQEVGGRPDQDLPGRPARPDQGLPGSGARPDQGLPNAPVRPDQGLPEKPVDPGFGTGKPPTDPGFDKPAGGRPDAGLPPAPVRPGGGPVLPEGGTKPIDPDAPEAGNELPESQPGVDNTVPGGEAGTKPVEPTEPEGGTKPVDPAQPK